MPTLCFFSIFFFHVTTCTSNQKDIKISTSVTYHQCWQQKQYRMMNVISHSRRHYIFYHNRTSFICYINYNPKNSRLPNCVCCCCIGNAYLIALARREECPSRPQCGCGWSPEVSGSHSMPWSARTHHASSEVLSSHRPHPLLPKRTPLAFQSSIDEYDTLRDHRTDSRKVNICIVFFLLTNMPDAPSANALKTSVPRRTPPSRKTGTWPLAALTTWNHQVLEHVHS